MTFDEWWNEDVPTPAQPEIDLYPTRPFTPRRIYYGPGNESTARAAWEAGRLDAADERDRLQAENDALRAMLERLEWPQGAHGDMNHAGCAICGGSKRTYADGSGGHHEPDCDLARLLGRNTETTEGRAPMTKSKGSPDAP